ncbi:MAG: hypothetical protein L6R35_004495, partial [Caloplaca aegaea]
MRITGHKGGILTRPRDALGSVVPGNVCIFYSTRLRFSATRFVSRTQRKFLQASHAPNKPPFAAAAVQEQIRYSPGDGEIPKQKSSFSGGWTKESPAVELTPEEAALRSRLQQNQPLTGSQESKPISFNISKVQMSNLVRKTAYDPRAKRDAPTQDTFLRSPPKQLLDACQWRCTSCGCHNPRSSTRCARCNSFNAQGVEVGEIVREVRYDRRSRQGPGAHSQGTGSSEQLGNYHAAAKMGGNNARDIFEGERRRRLDQTKGGHFVGFRSVYNQENAGSEFEESEIGAAQHRGSSNDPSLVRQSSQNSGQMPQRPNYVENHGSSPNIKHSRSEHGRNAYSPISDLGSDRERNRVTSEKSGLAATGSASTATARYTPVGGPHQTPRSAATAESVGDIRTAPSSYVLPEDLDEPPLRVFPPNGRTGIRNRPRHTAFEPSSGTATNAAAPYYDRQRQRRSRRVQQDYEEDDLEYDDDREEARKRRKAQRKNERARLKHGRPPTPIYLPEFISVRNLARVLRVRVEEFARKMRDQGFEETNNDHLLDAEVAGLIAVEFNFEPIVDTQGEDQNLQARPPPEDVSLLPPRPPIVTIMGHVDHGKTTLLDYLRKSSVAASEHGGITQHIGAFSVSMPGGRLVTFLDTPGHAAFRSMRQRGANVTDIVVLVVAADDSVKPQTVEAIRHAQTAKVPMIVAINKVDKEDKNIDRVKRDLARYHVQIEEFGGPTQVVCVSGRTGQGLDSLEESIVALADMLDMRAEADGQAEGWILEAATKNAGRVATVLVRRGTISRGDIIVAGTTWARIRTLKNEAGVQVAQAGPGTPVEVDGWKDQPTAGDEVLQATSEQQAKTAIDYRVARIEKEQMAGDMTAVNESRRLKQEKRDALGNPETESSTNPNTDSTSSTTTATDSQPSLSTTAETNTPITLPIILKADVSGSVEACVNAITALGTTAISSRVIRSSVGPISESDIAFATSSGAHIVSFNQKTPPEIYRLAEKGNVKLVEENVIYRLSDLVRTELQNLLPEKVESRVLGEAEVAKGFEISVGGRKKAMVAGCRVRNGLVSRANKVKVLRGEEGGGEVVFDGVLSSLKVVKKDVTEARKGG